MAEIAGAGRDVRRRDSTSTRSATGIARAFRPEPRRVATWPEVAAATRAIYEEVA